MHDEPCCGAHAGVYVEEGPERDALTAALAKECYVPVFLDPKTVCAQRMPILQTWHAAHAVAVQGWRSRRDGNCWNVRHRICTCIFMERRVWCVL